MGKAIKCAGPEPSRLDMMNNRPLRRCEAVYDPDVLWDRVVYEPGTSGAYSVVDSVPPRCCPICRTPAP